MLSIAIAYKVNFILTSGMKQYQRMQSKRKDKSLRDQS